MQNREPLVVKIGGKLFGEDISAHLTEISGIFEDISEICKGPTYQPIIIHGGGDMVDEEMKRKGKVPAYTRSKDGTETRLTDEETMKIFRSVMGKINGVVVEQLKRLSVDAHGFSGDNSPLLATRKSGRIDYREDEKGRLRRVAVRDYSGDIYDVQKDALTSLFPAVPVIPPIGRSPDSELYNIDGDKGAVYLARFLRAKRIVDLTDKDGVFINGQLVRQIHRSELSTYRRMVEGGMRVKLLYAQESFVMEGSVVEEFIIVSGYRDHPITSALGHYNSALGHYNCTVIS